MEVRGTRDMVNKKRLAFVVFISYLSIGNLLAQTPDCTLLNNPADGDTDVPITTGIQWTAVANATNYILTIATSPGGTDILDKWPVGSTLTYTPPSGLLPNTTYYVTVTPNNNSGNASNCPEERFTTGDSSGIPGCAVLVDPINGATGVPPDTDISWAARPEAVGYFLSVGTSPGSTDVLTVTDVGDTLLYDLPGNLPLFQQIYLTITPYNADGEMPGCTEMIFRTRGENSPMCTEIINPADGDQFVSVTANITWIRDFGASGYRMTIEEKSVGGVKILDNFDVGNGTNFKPPNFMGNTRYFVTITPYNDLGAAANCQPVSFTTGAAPPPPECTSLIGPKDGSGNVLIATDLLWNQVTGATGYILSVGTVSGGTDIADSIDVAGANTFDLVNDLPENSRIYVTVTPYNNNGLAEGCTEESFTTEGSETITEFSPVPKFFTPNNDGFNDLWIVASPSELPVVKVWIFNRFGQLLKQMESNMGWDGNFNGKPLASDSYWYRLEMSDGSETVGFFVLKR